MFKHVYQTIFLDKRDRQLWTMGEIDKQKIIRTPVVAPARA